MQTVSTGHWDGAEIAWSDQARLVIKKSDVSPFFILITLVTDHWWLMKENDLEAQRHSSKAQTQMRILPVLTEER